VRSIQKASLGFVTAGLLVAVTVGVSAADSETGVVPSPYAGTIPPTDSTTPVLVGPIAPTVPTLPTPGTAPLDNEIEPQIYHGRIQIPAIELDAPFIDGIRISTLDYGPGHWPGTAMPGERGNVVVAGHRTSHNADFRNLDQLEPGDEIIYDLDDSQGLAGGQATVPDPDTYTGRLVYVVRSVEIVQPDAMWIVTQDYRHETTLFACHPPGSVAERIVVHADLVDASGVLVDPPWMPTTTALAPATTAAG